MNRRVVITGIGVVNALGIGTEAFWKNLTEGKVGIARTRGFDPGGFACQLASEVGEYKITDHVPKSYRKATKVMARDIELAVVAADLAFKTAGLQSKAYAETPSFDVKRFGCNIGAGLISCDLDELTQAIYSSQDDNDPLALSLKKWGGEGMQQLTPLWLLKYLPNMLACHVTIVHGLMGPSNTITCDAASSHLAIGEAFRTIQRGKAEYAICGGAESRINPLGIVRQHLLKRVNETYNDRPAEALRPFDADAAGTVFGESAGLLILEEYESATKRGAKIYAELVGFAASQDAYKHDEPDPTGHSYGKAISNALKDAKLSANDISLLFPHGTGILNDDKAELNGIKKAFGDHASKVAVSPIKAQTALLGAGCGVDACAAVLSIQNQQIPPGVNTIKQTGDVKLNVSRETRDGIVDTVVSSVYSLGGQNAALVFKKL